MSTQDEIGRHLLLSSRRVRELLGAGVLPEASGSGNLDMDACRVTYIRYLRQLNETRETNRPIDDAKERLTRAQAELAEMEVKVRQEELVRLPAIALYWQEMRLVMRRRILAIPQNAAAVVAPEHYELALMILGSLVNEALTEIAGDAIPDEVRARFAPSPNGREQKRRRVGNPKTQKPSRRNRVKK